MGLPYCFIQTCHHQFRQQWGRWFSSGSFTTENNFLHSKSEIPHTNTKGREKVDVVLYQLALEDYKTNRDWFLKQEIYFPAFIQQCGILTFLFFIWKIMFFSVISQFLTYQLWIFSWHHHYWSGIMFLIRYICISVRCFVCPVILSYVVIT